MAVGSEYLGLADGTVIEVGLALATIEWFGRSEEVAVIIGGAGEALLGTAMLARCQLAVDFVERSVRIAEVATG